MKRKILKRKIWISMLLVLCLLALDFSAALAQETATPPPVSEKEFAALLAQAFPEAAPASGLTGGSPITYDRALEALLAALGQRDITAAARLAFAIENDLITGLAAIHDRQVSLADAKKMIASFAAYSDARTQGEMQERGAAVVAFFTGAADYMTGAPAPEAMPIGIGNGAAPMPRPFPQIDYNGLNDESYGSYTENRFLNPFDSPFSTFALDVDTASYANIRRQLMGGKLPDAGSIRIEEMLNYFEYDLPMPTAEKPISITTELAVCPWNSEHQLAMIALSGYASDKASLPGSNLVFLVDVSGSMEADNRLPLARKALKLLVSQLGPRDRVTIVTYAGTTGVLLNTTPADQKEKLEKAIDSMDAYGSTNGAGGIQEAYKQAREAFIDGGNNRVILLTDGDFNVGVQSAAELKELITKEREGGVYLSVLGFGMGNLKDYEMETLADYGNGNYAYIDTLKEAKKVLVEDMTGTIFTIAKDVKLQVEFNPAQVAAYRLIGYENRLLDTEDFQDDARDAGEMGTGRQMIALYEIIPAKAEGTPVPTAQSRYQAKTVLGGGETLYVSIRYKLPQGEKVMTAEHALESGELAPSMSGTMAFASAVAEFGLLLSNSPYKGTASLDSVLERALASREADTYGYRAEFAQIVDLTRLIQGE